MNRRVPPQAPPPPPLQDSPPSPFGAPPAFAAAAAAAAAVEDGIDAFLRCRFDGGTEASSGTAARDPTPKTSTTALTKKKDSPRSSGATPECSSARTAAATTTTKRGSISNVDAKAEDEDKKKKSAPSERRRGFHQAPPLSPFQDLRRRGPRPCQAMLHRTAPVRAQRHPADALQEGCAAPRSEAAQLGLTSSSSPCSVFPKWTQQSR
jgi:hypothetical protein